MDITDKLRGVAVGAAIGDALGMPLEFGGRIPSHRLVRDMQPGRIPAGSFTDDTEMALALAGSLLERFPLDGDNLAQHFVSWYRTGPSDVGLQTSSILRRIAGGQTWQAAAHSVQAANPGSAGNGSVMRCWPVALACHRDPLAIVAMSELQSRTTHPHADCVAGSAFVNLAIYHLLQGLEPRDAVRRTTDDLLLPDAVRQVIRAAPAKTREQLENSGWVRHTLESSVWGLLTTDTYEDAVAQVANLGNDADTAAAVTGAMAGAAYGLSAIPSCWRISLRGVWPVGSGVEWHERDFVELADRLAACALQ